MTEKEKWDILTQNKRGKTAQEVAIVEVLDDIMRSTKSEQKFDVVMLANNAASMHKNTRGTYAATTNPLTQALYLTVQKATNSIRTVAGTMAAIIDKALAEPNIAGIPIAAARVETNRDIEVSESMVVVQSTKSRMYWTDNAVPRLKEWNIEGYLTTISPLDSGCLIKPSLQWQAYYLDVCAKSRRPVLFKTNRGEFVKVQITNLHTNEEASYNNAIQVTMTLKEYNPYTIVNNPEENIVAIRNVL